MKCALTICGNDFVGPRNKRYCCGRCATVSSLLKRYPLAEFITEAPVPKWPCPHRENIICTKCLLAEGKKFL